jgi:hypothetical protein
VKEPLIAILLSAEEWKHISDEPAGNGGFQGYIRGLQERALPAIGGVTLTFDKEQMGDLLFHLIYGWEGSRGGFQGRLRKAFAAAIIRRIGTVTLRAK